MKVNRNISLKPYNTFGLDYKADYLVTVSNDKEAVACFKEGGLPAEPLLIMGEGSNILFISDYNGTIFHPEIEGIKLESQEGREVLVSAGAGVNWDHLVEWCVSRGYGGIENLSYIPGTVGAAPVQNIGAYGVEARDTIVKVKAVCTRDGSLKEFTNKECHFGYRDSIFKNELKGMYLITKVFFSLSTDPVFNTGYDLVRKEAIKLGGVTLVNIRQAVINIRRQKLPDPAILGNAGSFFKNPVVSNIVADNLRLRYPLLPAYPDKSGGVKLAAGWMIEKCGWKGKRIGDAGVHDKQALVLVNHGTATGREIFDLSEKVRTSVLEKFGIELQREVEVIGIT